MVYEELVIDFRPLARGEGCVVLSASCYGGSKAPRFEAPFAGEALDRLLRAIEQVVRRRRVGARHMAPVRSEAEATPLGPIRRRSGGASSNPSSARTA